MKGVHQHSEIYSREFFVFISAFQYMCFRKFANIIETCRWQQRRLGFSNLKIVLQFTYIVLGVIIHNE